MICLYGGNFYPHSAAYPLSIKLCTIEFTRINDSDPIAQRFVTIALGSRVEVLIFCLFHHSHLQLSTAAEIHIDRFR